MRANKGHSGTLMLLFDKKAVNDWENPLQNIMMDYCIHKVSFLDFIAPNSF